MPNFFDLPKPIRIKIYHLHLVRDEPVSPSEHSLIATYRSGGRSYYGIADGWTQKRMPPLLAISKQAEREAAPIYYGDNHFDFDPVRGASMLVTTTYPRHLRLIRKVTCAWKGDSAGEGFLAIARIKGLQELHIRVDEHAMVQQTAISRHKRQMWSLPAEDLTPQQQLAIQRYPGMSSLLAISHIPFVDFIKHKDVPNYARVTNGPIPQGYLETYVLPKLKGIRSQAARPAGLDDDTFPFLSLPPEIRNRIYSLLLCIDGKIHPSTEQPSSTQKKAAKRAFPMPTPESALNLLAVNRQVNDEAFAIFYHSNSFEFYYPTQLHAFLLSIGEERQKYLRDLTLHYYNYKVGGIDIAELTFPLLKQLSGLRRLDIVLDVGLHKLVRSNWYSSGSGWNISQANPLQIPGIKTLFSLRGITDIKLRCRELDKEFEEAKKDKEFPNFTAKSKKASVMKLNDVFDHFNKALADAQKGLVNKKMMDDPEWHMKDAFPSTDEPATDVAQAEAK